jgi:HEAT repeat protein
MKAFAWLCPPRRLIRWPGYSALLALGLAGCSSLPEAEPAIGSREEAREAIASADPDRRADGVEYLGDAADPALIPTISPLVRDPDKMVRLNATLALRNIADPAAAVPLREALVDADSDVRFSAASALFEIGDRTGEDALIEGLSSPRPDFRLQALMFLGKMRSRKAVPALVGLLKDEEPRIRSTAAYILGLLEEPSARGPLIAALSDESVWVRRDAWGALQAVSGEALIFHPDAEPAVREQETAAIREWAASRTAGTPVLPAPSPLSSPGVIGQD